MSEKRKGRPPSPAKRRFQVGVRLNEDELAQVKRNAAKASMRVMTYMRRVTLSGQVVSRLDEEGRAYRQTLIGLANNINQMARICHQKGFITALAMFSKDIQQISEILKKLNCDK